ncbi:MAG: thiamine ABC transporter ATP-binding protein [Alphaproteobacteria bacterium]|nr:thiamine ABC transporter ATP-binding protein [Alphaproteobacteria bacterium]
MTMTFTLRVPAGGITALIGPSGAGKTTLLNLIAGFERPVSGRVLIDGVDMAGRAPADRPVTMLFQEHNLFPHLTAADNVGLGIHPGLRLAAPERARVDEALDEIGLAGLGRRLPGQLSGGERQRVALARSLVRRRPILLLDEPFAALGPGLRRDMLALVDRLRRAQGLTVLMVSHDPGDARRIAERTAFVHSGHILAEGPTADVLGPGATPEVADYLGEHV